jgi:hypothetical protein
LTQKQKLDNRLKDVGLTRFSLFLGAAAKESSSEEVCKAANDMLDKLDSGDVIVGKKPDFNSDSKEI